MALQRQQTDRNDAEPSGRTPSGADTTVAGMDMLSGEQIAEAGLADWRKLAQGLHARFVVADFAVRCPVPGRRRGPVERQARRPPAGDGG